MATEWLAHFFFAMPLSQVTPQLRQNFAAAIAAGSGESVEDEALMFDSVERFSPDGNLPAVVVGIRLPVKASMRSAIRSLTAAVPQHVYYIIAQRDFTVPQGASFNAGDLVEVSDNRLNALGDQIGTRFSASDVLADINSLGYQRIVNES